MNAKKKRELTPTEGPAEGPASPIYASIVPVTFLKWGPRHLRDGYRTSFESEMKTCIVWVPQAPEIKAKENHVEHGTQKYLSL